MKRGDFVTIALQGDYGKPRPALVIQSDQFPTEYSVTVLLISGALVESPLFRVTIEPSAENGLRKTSQIQIDKAMTIRRDRVGEVIGSANAETMLAVARSLAVFLGIA